MSSIHVIILIVADRRKKDYYLVIYWKYSRTCEAVLWGLWLYLHQVISLEMWGLTW